MAESFERQLAKVAGTIHRVYMDGGQHQHRMENGLLYYWDKADKLRRSAELVTGDCELQEVFSMLAGMSLEVLLKGIARALDNPAPKKTHSLRKLVEHVGIAFSGDDGIILDAMSEHIYWAGRYTAPLKPEDWIKIWEIQSNQRRSGGSLANYYIESREISLMNYRALWARIADCFHRARESRYESAEFSWEQQFKPNS
jgi:HEPN domain-containing protein